MTRKEQARWEDVTKLVTRQGGFMGESFEPGPETLKILREDVRVLVVGAGGLGCELLKGLALLGITDMTVVDLDTVDESNLNRQFLFRAPDVGKSKAEVAAKRVNERVRGAKVEGHQIGVEELSLEWLSTFSIACLGLDSVEARSRINAHLCSLVEYDMEGNPVSGLIPMVDGGTEGFKGHARVIVPGLTPCFECTRWLFPPQQSYPMCTLAETPRAPEHCIEYARLVQWSRERPSERFDPDDPEHLQWLHNKASQRADSFGIEGVTLKKTHGVIKNIVPAVPSTNAIVASACALEAAKLATGFCQSMNNYTMYIGTEGIYSHTAQYERDPECPVCSPGIPERVSLSEHLDSFISRIKSRFGLQGPSLVSHGSSPLYMTGSFESDFRPNLEKPLSELLSIDTPHSVDKPPSFRVDDPSLMAPLRIRLIFSS